MQLKEFIGDIIITFIFIICFSFLVLAVKQYINIDCNQQYDVKVEYEDGYISSVLVDGVDISEEGDHTIKKPITCNIHF